MRMLTVVFLAYVGLLPRLVSAQDDVDCCVSTSLPSGAAKLECSKCKANSFSRPTCGNPDENPPAFPKTAVLDRQGNPPSGFSIVSIDISCGEDPGVLPGEIVSLWYQSLDTDKTANIVKAGRLIESNRSECEKRSQQTRSWVIKLLIMDSDSSKTTTVRSAPGKLFLTKQ